MTQMIPVLPQQAEFDEPRFDLNDLDSLPRHNILETFTEMLCDHVGNNDPHFMRMFALSFLAPVAASMRVTIDTEKPGNEVPVNTYTLAIAPSGFGKNKAQNLMKKLLKGFSDRFIKETYPIATENALWERAAQDAAWSGETEQKEYDKLKAMFRKCGSYQPSARTFTESRIGQMRNKTILANAGCVNLIVDEIGQNLSNVSGQFGPMNLFLTLYDVGMIEESAIKSQSEDKDDPVVDGWAAACAIMYGEPTSLLDGGDNQDKLFSLLSTGYGRRFLYAWGTKARTVNLTASELLARARSKKNTTSVDQIVQHFTGLADVDRLNWHVSCPDDVLLAWINYQLDCRARADMLPTEQSILAAEVEGRFFKALKIAGILAFMDESQTCEMQHLGAAVRICEEQGDALLKVLFQAPAHVRLARWLAERDEAATHADIFELPFMSRLKNESRRKEQLTLAASWGYSNNVLIKRGFMETVEMFWAETLKETDLDNLSLSYSNHNAYNYQGVDNVPFDQLEELVSMDGMHWTNHRFEDGHRREENVIPGFNMIVLDCDGDVSLDTVHELFANTTFMTYTTKRHQTEGKDRFRLILPTNYILNLDVPDYTQFMDGVLEWMPFWSKEKSDSAPRKPEAKWLTCDNSQVHYNRGKLFDVLPFIPKTTRNQEHRQQNEPLRNLGNLERYFLRLMGDGNSGNRNHTFARYAFALVDAGMNLFTIEGQVRALNAQLANPLDPSELQHTVLKSAAQRIMERAA